MSNDNHVIHIRLNLRETHQQAKPYSREVPIIRDGFSPRKTLRTITSVIEALNEYKGTTGPLSVCTLYDQDDLDSDVFHVANALIDLLGESRLGYLPAPMIYIENPTQEIGDGTAFAILQAPPILAHR